MPISLKLSTFSAELMGSAARTGKDDKSLLWSFGAAKNGQTPYKVL